MFTSAVFRTLPCPHDNCTRPASVCVFSHKKHHYPRERPQPATTEHSSKKLRRESEDILPKPPHERVQDDRGVAVEENDTERKEPDCSLDGNDFVSAVEDDSSFTNNEEADTPPTQATIVIKIPIIEKVDTEIWAHPATSTRIAHAPATPITAPKRTVKIPTEVGERKKLSDPWAHPSTATRIAHTAKSLVVQPTVTGPPKLPASAALRSHTAYNSRQLILDKFYEAFRRIYAPILSLTASLAADHALKQEAKVYESSNKLTYRNVAANVFMRLKKREPAKDATDIGIDGEYPPAPVLENHMEIANGQKRSFCGVTRNQLSHYVLSEVQLKTFGYPLRFSSSYQGATSPVGDTRSCSRCTRQFTVFSPSSPLYSSTECSYHWGKLVVEAVRGEKQRMYTCCRNVVGSSGCANGPHVWRETDLERLHVSEPFVECPNGMQTNEGGDNGIGNEKKEVVALDCEMSYTTGGLELTRLTVIDGRDGSIIMDDIVKPRHEMVDLNTRFSGVTSLEKAVGDLEFVRNKMFRFVGRETIIVGQSLESDFKALRLIHCTVVDTAELFPHPRGYPIRHSLKVLTSKYLQRFIQNGKAGGEEADGHDSYEDALASLELCAFRIKHEGSLVL